MAARGVGDGDTGLTTLEVTEEAESGAFEVVVEGEALAEEVVCVRRCDLVSGDCWYLLLCGAIPGERNGEAGADALKLVPDPLVLACCWRAFEVEDWRGDLMPGERALRVVVLAERALRLGVPLLRLRMLL